MMHLRGVTGASNTREIWRRAAVLIAVAMGLVAGMAAVPGSSARADGSTPYVGIDVLSTALSDAYEHGVPIVCDAPSLQQTTHQDDSPPGAPCTFHVKITVTPWIVRQLKLGSATLATGSAKGPYWQDDYNGNGSHVQDVYVFTLPQSLVRKLKSEVIDRFRLNGLYVTVSGTVSFPFNNYGNSSTTTTDTQSFDFPRTQLGPGYVNSCWTPVNQPPQIALADPHGKLCPGYR